MRPADAELPAAAREAARRRRLEDRRLLIAYHRDGDRAARDRLVERFLPLARQLAARYENRTESFDDLLQVAAVGLVKAVDRFDPDRGTAFSSFAVPTILGELRRHFRDKGWSVHVPRQLQELALRVETAVARASRELGRSPSVAELAGAIGESEHDVLEALAASRSYHAVSLDRPVSDEQGDGESLGALIGGEDPGFGRAEDAATVDRMVSVLSERERLVLRLRFQEDLTQAEIGERIGVSQMHVSRILSQALRRLRVLAQPGRRDEPPPS